MVALGSVCSWLDDCAEVIREKDNRLGGNHLYSVAALTDNSGNVVERYRYDAYGQRTVLAADGTTVRPTSSYGNQYGFTGRYLDKETGLWHFRTRYYSTMLGCFITRDKAKIKMFTFLPLALDGYIDGYNFYSAYFVPNTADPKGESAKCKCECISRLSCEETGPPEIFEGSIKDGPWEKDLSGVAIEVDLPGICSNKKFCQGSCRKMCQCGRIFDGKKYIPLGGGAINFLSRTGWKAGGFAFQGALNISAPHYPVYVLTDQDSCTGPLETKPCEEFSS